MSYGDSKRELRDRFAMHCPQGELDDISYRSLSKLAKEALAGRPCPVRPSGDSACTNIEYQMILFNWECAVSAALRYKMADAMLAERETVKPVRTLAFYKDVRGVLEKMLKDEKQFSAQSEFSALENYRCVTNLVIAMLNEAISRESQQ